ncbi:hypothetical protein [Weissella minor]|uniref:hypothetical protein n=1 Tax=Weissella minor TaxID=1620 RepID=UPI003AF298BE
MELSKLTKLKKSRSKVSEEPLKLLPDKYQFKISDLEAEIELTNLLELADSKMIEDGVPSYKDSAPFVSLIFVEEFIRLLKVNKYSGQVLGLDLIEYDFPELGERTKKNKTPEKRIVDSFRIDFKVNDNTTHVPQIIAEFMMNYQSKDAGYEGRVQYIQDILGNYSKVYGALFSKRFGLMPEKSVDLPPENKWRKMYENRDHIAVAALYDAEKMQPLNKNQPQVPTPNPKRDTEVVPIVSEQPKIPATLVDDSDLISNEQTVQPKTKNHTNRPGVFEDVNEHSESTTQPKPINVKKNNRVQPISLKENEVVNHTFDLEQAFKELEGYRNAGEISLDIEVPEYEPDVPITDEYFVENQINKKLAEQNEELVTIIDSLNESSKSYMGKDIDIFIDQLKKAIFDFDNSIDLPEKSRQITTPTIKKNKETELEKGIQSIDQELSDNLEAEEARHASAVSKIKNNATQDKNKLSTQIEEKYKAEFDATYNQTLADETEKFNKLKDNKIMTLLTQYKSNLQTKAEILRTESFSYLDDTKGIYQEALDEYKSEQYQNYLKARDIRSREVQNQNSDALISQLQDQITKQENIIDQGFDETEKLQAQIEKQKNKIESLELQVENADMVIKRVKENNFPTQVQTNAQVDQVKDPFEEATKTLDLVKQMQGLQTTPVPVNQSENETRKFSSRNFLLGTLAVGILGGSLFFSVNSYQQISKSNDRTSSLQKKLEKKDKLEKKATDSRKNENTSSNESNSNESNTDSSASSRSTKNADFSDLDADLAQGGVTVYQQKYVGKDLKSDERTLKVGQSLVQAGDAAAAIQVVKDNPDHNTLLKEYLGM